MSTDSWIGRAAMLAAMAGIAATQSGCIEVALLMALDDDDDDPPDPSDEWDPPPVETPVAPQVQTVIADWPPVGPSATITINAASRNGIDSAQLSFRNEVTVWANGELNTTFFPTGLDLGEGLGRLAVTVTGRDGAWTTQYVEDLLVDLSPPVAVLGPTTLPASGASFDFWMGDAWVVSSARLEFGGEVVEELLEEGYPDTLGVEWDYSLVRVPVEELPAITDVATITVRDAAGNESSQEFTLSIDGTAPTASFSAPEDGATVTGIFQIVVDAFDQQPGPLVIEVSAGGAPLATAVGPEAVLFVDASELAEGPLTLTAIARDEAGNVSLSAEIDVVVVHGGDEEEPAPEG